MVDQPYIPSWVNRLIAYIERLPPPSWIIYLLIAIPLVVIFIAVQAWQGAYKEEGFFAWHIFVAVQPLYGLAMIDYLDRVATKAIHQFRPLFKGDEQDFNTALFRLTNIPARPTVIAVLMGMIFVVLSIMRVDDPETLASWQSVASTTISLTLLKVNIFLAWIGYAVAIYHTIHQLRVIDWLYTSKADIDPYYQEPLYALSGITSRSAIIVIIVLYGWSAVASGGITSPTSDLGFLFTVIPMASLALIAFILPHWGAHQLLAKAKSHALANNSKSYKEATLELQKTISQRAMDQIDVWHKALSALDMERQVLSRLPTWPWPPDAFRNLILAMVVPIFVWIVQYGLQQLLE